MKEKILAMLKAHKDGCLSGEEISRKLHVSRTAVWKHIGALREEGYTVESQPRLGYRLLGVPDLLLPQEVREGLSTYLLGAKIHYLPTVDSTNRLARELAAAGELDGTVVLAEEQTAGRGRLGRSWNSPAGGVWLSLLLRPRVVPQKAQLFTLLAAVAASEATETVAGVRCGIKWPNDLLLSGKKVAGILTEISAEMERVNFLILGLGINLNVPQGAFAPEVSHQATSILAHTGRTVSRAAWVRAFLSIFEQDYLSAEVNGFTGILDRWRSYSVTLGQEIQLRVTGRETVEGAALDIDGDGGLIVLTAKGKETFVAGEVTLLPKIVI